MVAASGVYIYHHYDEAIRSSESCRHLVRRTVLYRIAEFHDHSFYVFCVNHCQHRRIEDLRGHTPWPEKSI